MSSVFIYYVERSSGMIESALRDIQAALIIVSIVDICWVILAVW